MEKKENKYHKLILLFKLLTIIGIGLTILFCTFASISDITKEYNTYDKIAIIILIFLGIDCLCMFIMMSFFKKKKIYF